MSTASLDQILPAIGSLTPSQQTVLTVVSRHDDPITVAELASECGLHINTVREPLDVLLSLGLVEREQMPISGRGRPAWGYISRALSGTTSSVELLRHVAYSTVNWIRAGQKDPIEAGRDLGHHLGDNALTIAKVPDHAAVTGHYQFSIRSHMAKIRVFFTAFGLAAEQHPELPNALILRGCPFADPKNPDTVALAIRQGIVERVIERTSCGKIAVSFYQSPDPMVCKVILHFTGIVPIDQEQ